MDIVQTTYLMALMSMLAGIMEFPVMRGYVGNMYYKEDNITNAEQVFQSVYVIFEKNKSLYMAFPYAYVFLSSIGLLTGFMYFTNTINDYAFYWSMFSMALILMHVLVPYKLTYINFVLDSMKRDVDFKLFLNNNLMVFKNNKELSLINLESNLLVNLKERVIDLKFNEYNKYLDLINELTEYRKNIFPLSQEDYEKYIGSFDDKQLIVRDKRDNFESIFLGRKGLTIFETDPATKDIYFKLFRPEPVWTLMFIRVAEVPMFFIIFLYLNNLGVN